MSRPKLKQLNQSGATARDVVLWNNTTGKWEASNHAAIRQLIHFIDDGPAEGFTSGAHKEIIGQPFPTQIIWWESVSKSKKIVEKIITRSGGSASLVTPSPITWNLYDDDGATVLATVTDVIEYDGVFPSSRTRTLT